MALQAFKPKFVDYLLSGVAGAAKGAEIGITRRQGIKRQEAAAEATAAFKQQQLDLQREDFEASKRFRMQQESRSNLQFLETKKQSKEQRKFLKEMLGLKTEAEKDVLGFKKGLVNPVLELIGIKQAQATLEKTQTDVRLGASLIASREAKTDLDAQAQVFTEGRATVEDIQFQQTLLANAAVHIFDAETAAEMARFKALTTEWLGRGKVSNMSMFLMRSVNSWEWLAGTAETDAEKQFYVAQAIARKKDLVGALSTFDKLEYKPADITYEDRQWPRSNRVVVSGEPEFTLPESGPRPELAQPQGAGFMQQLQGMLGGGAAAPAGLPAPMQELMGPPPPPAKSQSEIQSMISFFRDEENIKELSPDDVAKLQRLGYSDEDIVAIQEGL